MVDSMDRMRNFAIVPAAGLSLRMGKQHKLLLPWNDGQVIDAVLQAWTKSRIDAVAVVVRRGDTALQRACQRWPIALVTPEVDPSDMKMSIGYGLEHLASKFQPGDQDRWLVAPADLPLLSSELINQLVAAGATPEDIVVPRFGSRSGHPVSFPWLLRAKVANIPVDSGLNWLLAHHPTQWIDLPADLRPADIDTPEEYQRLYRERSR